MRLLTAGVALLLSLCAIAASAAEPIDVASKPLATPATNSADTAPPGETLDIALVTMGPGEVYWQRFGHNAIRVVDRSTGEDTLYNYGMFDFAEKDFFLNFLRGQMRYSLLAAPTARELRQYAFEGRWVDVQWLALSPAQRTALRDFLEWNARPEHRHYRYDYFESNCSTKVRDAIDRALGGTLRASLSSPSPLSYRAQALRLTAPDFWLAQGIHAGLGPYADLPRDRWADAFVPMSLQASIRDLALGPDGAPLVAREERLLEARLTDPAPQPPDWRVRYLVVGLLVAGVLAGLARRPAPRRWLMLLATTIWLIAGLGGLVLLGLWTLTEHRSAHANLNLLLFNPLALALAVGAPLALARGRSARRSVRIVALAVVTGAAIAPLLLLAGHPQLNGDWIALWLPIHVALTYALLAPPGPARRAR